MNFLLVAGGILQDSKLLLAQIAHTQYDFILAIDRGYDHCLTLGLCPNLVMGDLDSAAAGRTADAYCCEVVAFPPEKDETDLRLAVDYAYQQGASQIDIICATGGRLDQFMGNLSLLEYLSTLQNAPKTQIIDEENVISFLSANNISQQYTRHSKYISIIPISESICFSGENLKYPATQLTVKRTEMVSISNESLGETFSITLHKGKALLIEAQG